MLWLKGEQLDYFVTSLIFPVWVQYFQSYKNDALVKQLVLMFSLNICGDGMISFSYMHRILQDAGYITSPDSDRAATMLLLAINNTGPSRHMEFFLFFSKYSGPFHCTRDEYVDAYCHMLTTCRRLYDTDRLGEFLEAWSSGLIYLRKYFKMKHPMLLKNLKSEAQEFHDNDMINSKLTYHSEHRLFYWFKELKRPQAHEVMVLWQKVFEKARGSTVEGLTGHSYFCNSDCQICNRAPGRS
ncbi:hypothetical protein BDQ17DRAFT_1362510 [Cyathus striatus]|nr:hypothetical protein BDQ17DRAFT_1362510 [Cyathus striatus]